MNVISKYPGRSTDIMNYLYLLCFWGEDVMKMANDGADSRSYLIRTSILNLGFLCRVFNGPLKLYTFQPTKLSLQIYYTVFIQVSTFRPSSGIVHSPSAWLLLLYIGQCLHSASRAMALLQWGVMPLRLSFIKILNEMLYITDDGQYTRVLDY
jgi:hypothetical protein